MAPAPTSPWAIFSRSATPPITASRSSPGSTSPPRSTRPSGAASGSTSSSRQAPFEDDPNLTDKKFAGNPTQSYWSRAPLRIVGEVAAWQPHSPERLKDMKDFLARLEAEGDMRIID